MNWFQRASREAPVVEADVVAWTGATYGWRHARRRVADAGDAFHVSTQADGVFDGTAQTAYGGLTVLVLKSTGEYWSIGSFPDAQPVLHATTEARIRELLPNAHKSSARPEGRVPASGESEPDPWQSPGLSESDVVRWAGESHGHLNARRRVSDHGEVYLVSTQDDAVLEGRVPATAGALTVVVLKRTGEYWRVGSFPDARPVLMATTEAELRRLLPQAHLDPARPEGWVEPTGPEQPEDWSYEEHQADFGPLPGYQVNPDA
ncbi:hypothetical protein [Amycolatopsis sp. lyj-112]|uniref:hypothetical protein n=1 Tax=Amycolatopsis sp. lyj-112 TaxID=2789288 RepID=UPI00397CE11E